MRQRPIIDAGPSLNFFSINKERLLIDVLGPLSVPETVEGEVLRKSRQDARFRAAEAVWGKLRSRLLHILPDDETPELAAVVHRMTRQPMRERVRQPRDLGELMVIAHAVVVAEAGSDVTVLIDDGQGARIATDEAGRLQRLRANGRTVGSIQLVSTLTVLQAAAGGKHIPDRAAMRDIYQRLRGLDNGLLPIEKTDLLSPARWRTASLVKAQAT